MNQRSHPRFAAPSVKIAAFMWIATLSAGVALLALYRRGNRSVAAFLAAPMGWVFLSAAVLFTCVTVLLAYLPITRPALRRGFVSTLLLNLWSLLFACVTAEAMLRVFAIDTPVGSLVANTVLLPRDWPVLASRNQRLHRALAAHPTFLVPDSELGWTVGSARTSGDYNAAFEKQYLRLHSNARPVDSTYRERVEGNRNNDDSIYASSIEGLRSPRAGISFATSGTGRRIALVGDSFTFGLEVPYDETWGHQLEMTLGTGYQVLNFGVDGYGIDQAYLRYRRDVPKWHPAISILAIINDDVRRTMCVYSFLCFPGAQLPFAKPRFTLNGSKLGLLNMPLPDMESMLSRKTISELPFIEYDTSFDPEEWKQRPFAFSYSIRYLLSRFRPWALPRPMVADDALHRVNGEIVKAFVHAADSMGSVPLVVFLPSSEQDLDGKANETPLAKDVLNAAGVPYLDMTECVRRVKPEHRFLVLHYSAASNRAISRCLSEAIATIQLPAQ